MSTRSKKTKTPAGYIVAYTIKGKRGKMTSDWDVFLSSDYLTTTGALQAARVAYDELVARDSTYSVSLTAILLSTDYF